MHAGVHLSDARKCIIGGVTSVSTEHSAAVSNMPGQRGGGLCPRLSLTSPLSRFTCSLHCTMRTYSSLILSLVLSLSHILHFLSSHLALRRSNPLNYLITSVFQKLLPGEKVSAGLWLLHMYMDEFVLSFCTRSNKHTCVPCKRWCMETLN